MPRIAPITGKADVAPEHHAVVEQVEAVFGNVRGPFSMLLHSPQLAERAVHLVKFIREQSIVEGKLRSLAVLAFVRERESPYVWAAQVNLARENGLREPAIDILRAKGDLAALEPHERDIARFGRQLARSNRVDQTLFDTLLQRYGVQWLVELTAAINFYGMLAGIANAFEVPALADGDRF
jgi:4-carboxymuconolactone decarboxylase